MIEIISRIVGLALAALSLFLMCLLAIKGQWAQATFWGVIYVIVTPSRVMK